LAPVSSMSWHLKPRQCNAFALVGFRVSSSSNICNVNDALSSAVPVLHTNFKTQIRLTFVTPKHTKQGVSVETRVLGQTVI